MVKINQSSNERIRVIQPINEGEEQSEQEWEDVWAVYVHLSEQFLPLHLPGRQESKSKFRPLEGRQPGCGPRSPSGSHCLLHRHRWPN